MPRDVAPEPQASAGTTAALPQALATEPLAARFAIEEQFNGTPLELLPAPPAPPPGSTLSWVTVADEPTGAATTVRMQILDDSGEIVGATRSEAEELP